MIFRNNILSTVSGFKHIYNYGMNSHQVIIKYSKQYFQINLCETFTILHIVDEMKLYCLPSFEHLKIFTSDDNSLLNYHFILFKLKEPSVN